MIISEQYGFLFVANLRTASSSIHAALGPVATTMFHETGKGKHLHLTQIYERFGSPISSLFKWGVIRDPVSHLQSLYVFHKATAFDGRPHSTVGVTFEEYFFGDQHDWMRLPQSSRFLDPDGELGLDLLLTLDRVSEGFSYVKFRLGLPNLLLPALNTSNRPPIWISPDLERQIRNDYAVDYETIERHGNKERTGSGWVEVLREPKQAASTTAS